jgi:hypothetical protein
MGKKGTIGFVTEATRLQAKYEKLLSKTKKTEAEWIKARQGIVSLIEFLNKDINSKADGEVYIHGIMLEQTLIAQRLICEVGASVTNLSARLVKLEKRVDNLCLKIR